VIGFLADLLGLGDLPAKVKEFIEAVQGAVDHAIEVALDWLIEQGKKLFAALFSKKDDKEDDERTDEKKQADRDKGMAEAEALFAHKGMTPDKLKEHLLPIKTKYKMTSLDLIVEGQDQHKETVHVEGSMSPPVPGPQHTLQKSAHLVEAKCNLGVKGGVIELKNELADISRTDLEALQALLGVGTEANLTNVQLQGQRIVYEVDVVLGPPIPRQGAEDEFPRGSQVGLMEPVQGPGSIVRNVPYQRAHIIGPGFGIELPMIMYAPEKINQDLQNRGVEKLLRELTDKIGEFADIHVTAHATTQTGSLRLGQITYIVEGQQEGQPMEKLLEVSIDVEGTVQSPKIISEATFVSGALQGILGQTWSSYVEAQDPAIESAVKQENKRIPQVMQALVAQHRNSGS